MWTEDFTGGQIVTADNCWRELVAETSESDIPLFRSMNDVESTKAYVRKSLPIYASFQLIFDPQSRVEVRGADYFPVKAIQQHFMEYELPTNVRGAVPYLFTAEQKGLVSRTLSDARDLYILRNIALHADRTKRNVLVLGAGHTSHIAHLMIKYGVKCQPVFPCETK
jgi:hypothetical protein